MIDGVDVAHVGGRVGHIQAVAGEPFVQKCGSARIAASGLLAHPGCHLVRVDRRKQPGEELEVQPLVFQTEFEVASERVGGLVWARPGQDLVTVHHLALPNRPQAAAGAQRLDRSDAMDLSQAMKTQGGIAHDGQFVIDPVILLEKFDFGFKTIRFGVWTAFPTHGGGGAEGRGTPNTASATVSVTGVIQGRCRARRTAQVSVRMNCCLAIP